MRGISSLTQKPSASQERKYVSVNFDISNVLEAHIPPSTVKTEAIFSFELLVVTNQIIIWCNTQSEAISILIAIDIGKFSCSIII